MGLSPGLNLFFGENGSGKTSVLESIYLLSTGQSFRSRISKNYVSFGQTQCVLFTALSGDSGPTTVGIQKQTDGKTLAKIDGMPISSAQALSIALPCHIFHSGSFGLLEGGPQQRRAFLDWLVFHVKHDFKAAWSEYVRCLKQRNALLRHGKISPKLLEPWDNQLSAIGTRINDDRVDVLKTYFDQLRFFAEMTGLKPEELKITFQQGWDEDATLHSALQSRLDKDLAYGHTSVGPHKADIKIKYCGRPIEDVLSRGQLKTFIASMHVAKIACYKQLKGVYPVLLMDDIPAELDEEHQEMIFDWLLGFETQMFVTAIDKDRIISIYNDKHTKTTQNVPIKMFHVKQGRLTEHDNKTIGDVNV